VSLTETDLDLLADYSEGLLDGPDATRVADLIASDEEWALTYQLLTGASTGVGQALDSYAQETPELPAEVSQRIDDALQSEREQASAPVSLDAARRRRESRRSWLGLSAAAAAAVIVAVVFGLGALGLNLGGGSSSSSTSEGVRPDSAEGGASAALGAVIVTSSGTNYTQDNLGKQPIKPNAITTFGGSKAANSQSSPDRSAAPGPMSASGGRITPDLALTSPLQRLTYPANLSACLTAIETVHGGTVTTVDYARYEGGPALVATLVSPGLRVAVGPDCGLPSSGAAELATAPTR
jgi:hypothetical protein